MVITVLHILHCCVSWLAKGYVRTKIDDKDKIAIVACGRDIDI